MMWGVWLACAFVTSLATATAPAACGPKSSPDPTCAAPKSASAGASALGRDHSMLQVTRGAVAARGARDVHASEEASESPSPSPSPSLSPSPTPSSLPELATVESSRAVRTKAAKLDAELETAASKPIPDALRNDVPIQSVCDPEYLRDVKVKGVYNIMGSVHEAFVVHLDVDEYGDEQALLMEWGTTSFDQGTYSRVMCSGMTWKGEPTTKEVASTYGNCLSSIGRALGSSSTSWSTNTIGGSSNCPMGGNDRRGNSPTSGWKLRNSMGTDWGEPRDPADAGKPMRKIQPINGQPCTYGDVVKEARQWVHDHPDYSFASNNCQDFAVHMFSKITGSTVKTDTWCKMVRLSTWGLPGFAGSALPVECI